MSRKLSSTKRGKLGGDRPRTDSPEGGAADFLTIGWALSVLTMLGCEVLAMASAVASRLAPSLQLLLMFSDLLLFAAIVLAPLSLVLLIVAWRLRAEAIPGALVAASLVIVALAPLLAWVRVTR